MDSTDLIPELPVHGEDKSIPLLKRGIYRRYFNRKIGMTASLLSAPLAVILCILHILLIVEYFLNHEGMVKRPMLRFEISGIGIISSVLSAVAIVVTLKTSFETTFSRLLLTLLLQAISLSANLGVVIFAISSIQELSRSRNHLFRCSCLDSTGNVERNGTYPNYYDCRSILKPTFCADVDEQVDYILWERSVIWIMVAAAGISVILSIVPGLMSIRTILMLQETFDRKAYAIKGDENSSQESLYGKYFSSRTTQMLAWLQLGFIAFLILLMISIDPLLESRSRAWSLTQLLGIGSYAVLKWMTLPGNRLSYFKLLAAATLHFLSTCGSVAIIFLLRFGVYGWQTSRNVLYPFVSMQIILSGGIAGVMIRPLTIT